MNCETQFQSIEELMEYVNEEAERRAKEILKKHGISPDRDLNLKNGAPAEYLVSIQTYALRITKIAMIIKRAK